MAKAVVAAAITRWNGVAGAAGVGGPWDAARRLAAYPPYHAALNVTGDDRSVELSVPPTSVVGVVLKL